MSELKPLGWITEDYMTDKSATTYDPVVAERWRSKGWPVSPIYSTPQPVTPAGGEFEPVAWLHKDGYTMMLDKESHRFTHPEYWTALYTNPPVADAALAELLSAADEARSILGGLDYYDLRRRLECAIAALNQRGGGV